MIDWWENLTDWAWIRFDIARYRLHRYRCEACRDGTTIPVCHCGNDITTKNMCHPCSTGTHPRCWCSVRAELADDINNPT